LNLDDNGKWGGEGVLIIAKNHAGLTELSIEWRLFWEHSFDNLIVVNNLLQVAEVNPEAKKLLENLAVYKDEEEILVELVSQLNIEEKMAQGKPRFNLQVVIANNRLIANVIPIQDNLQLIILKDLTKLKEAEETIKLVEETSQELSDIINLSADGLVSVDGNGTLLRMNHAYEQIVGVKAEEFVGKPVIMLKEKGFMPDLVSTHVLKDLKQKNMYLKIREKDVLLTGRPVFNNSGELVRIVANIRDLTDLNELKEEIQKFSQLTSRYETELKRLRAKEFAGTLVGNSPEMQKVVDKVVQVAQVDSNVLICGESGTGKELAAKMVHLNSERKDGPFIPVNCGALTASLLESELFGYLPGAFTGADKKGKMGLFEAAHEGTLFLDEIGELPYEMQVKLLRVIQEKKVRRVGSSQEVEVDVRFVFATNKDLKNMVEEKLFREDLFYRLNVIRIWLPPLRERKEDIPRLVEYFLRRLNQKYGFNKRIPEEIMQRLGEHDWPGNVRELESTIERLVVLSQGLNLDLQVIKDEITGSMGSKISVNKSLKEILEEVEQEILKKAYRESRSTRKVAKRLGISQATVARKLQKYKETRE
jgi:TyrR family helix-turn-helix protein/PAS domain S-box-containing protein